MDFRTHERGFSDAQPTRVDNLPLLAKIQAKCGRLSTLDAGCDFPSEGPSRPLAVTRGKPLPPTYICRNMAWRRGTISPHADFRCGRFPSPGRAREHPACGLCGARSCARRVAGPVERINRPAPRHAFSPCHVPAAQSACRMIGSNSENPITPTSRQSPGPVYLYERRGVYGA